MSVGFLIQLVQVTRREEVSDTYTVCRSVDKFFELFTCHASNGQRIGRSEVPEPCGQQDLVRQSNVGIEEDVQLSRPTNCLEIVECEENRPRICAAAKRVQQKLHPVE